MANLLKPAAWRQNSVSQGLPAGSSYNIVTSYAATARIVTDVPVPTYGQSATIEFADGYMVWVCAFDENVKYLGLDAGHSGSWQSSPYACDFDGAQYLAIAVRKASNGAITPDEAGSILLSVTLAGGGAVSMNNPINLFDYDQSSSGVVGNTVGAVDPLLPADTTYKERYSAEFYPVSAGQVLKIVLDATGGQLWSCIAFYNESRKQLARPARQESANVTHSEWSATAPTNTAYAKCSARFYEDGVLRLETEADPDDSAWGGSL